MRSEKQIKLQQKYFIDSLKKETIEFIENIEKTEIFTILLSGSVARGDYFPGSFGGMIDLIVLKNPKSKITAENIFGKNQNPAIPFHCVKYKNLWFQILFTDFFTAENFSQFEMAKKFSVLESIILFDKNNIFQTELAKIENLKLIECKNELKNKIAYINYLLSPYKTDRWQRRNAFLQMHENLNTAIRAGVECLFYKNNSYCPAEDRLLYYSFSLSNLPQNYKTEIYKLKNQDSNSEENYYKREALFKKLILDFIKDGCE